MTSPIGSAAIRPGYKMALISPEGEVLDTIDLEGWDLTKSAAGAALADDILSGLGSEAFES